MQVITKANAKAAEFDELGPLVLRLGAGIVFLVYGVGKVFNAGPEAQGIDGFAGFLTSLGVPAPQLFAWVVGLVELVGGIALILGALTRVFAVLLGIDMIFAIVLWHLPKGWSYQDGGFEYPLLLLFVSVTLLLVGPGRLALDTTLLDTETRFPAAAANSG